MKRLICSALFLLSTAPAFCSERISVAELKERIQSLHDAQKSDADATSKLIEIELSESLSAENESSLQSLLPGKDSREQLNYLAVLSAFLAPPSAEVPSPALPDVATQKAILGKCVEYVTKIYMHNPHLMASKTTTYLGYHLKDFHAQDIPYVIGRAQAATRGAYLSHTTDIESENGIEKAQASHEKERPIESQVSTGPVLSFVLAQAAQGGHLAWMRWQLIGGKRVAVFTFAVDKSKSQYQVNYCCFEKLEAKHDPGSYRYDEHALPFKATVPFHGAFFIDPETGTIARLILQADLAATDPVHREDTRIDYGPVTVGNKTVTVPIAAYTLVALVPSANEDPRGYHEAGNLTEADYRNYRLADGKALTGSR